MVGDDFRGLLSDSRPMRTQRRAWRAGATALAVALSIGLLPLQASALALGRVTVLSALGEPLRAEIELPQASPDEIASLRVSLASPEAYRAAGLNRLPLLQDLQVTLQTGANGGPVLRLSLDRPVNEPTLDLLLDARWAAGQILRDYTVLLDPPQLRPVSPLAPLAPLASAAPAPAPSAGLDPSQGAVPGPERATGGPTLSTSASAAAKAAPEAPQAGASAPSAQASSARRRVTVQAGQTAARIVAPEQAPGISLDQMLLALLQSNPQAFAGGNMNRLKTGAVLDLPTADEARGVDPAQARQTVRAQSRDFNEFRQRLAQGVSGTAPVGEEASRQATGRVDARVEDRATASPTPDRLTLSKGSVEGRGPAAPSAEDRLAAERQAQDSAARERELQRNIAELSRLGVTASSGNAGSAASAPSAAGLGLGAVPALASPAASAASSPETLAPVAATSASSAAAAPATASRSTPEWLEHPMLVWVIGGFSTLLLIVGLFQRQRQSRAAQRAGAPADLGTAAAGTRPAAGYASAEGAFAVRQPVPVPAGLDLDIDSFKIPAPAAGPDAAAMPVGEADEFTDDFDDAPYAASGTPAAAALPARAAPALNFPGLSLDLDTPPPAADADVKALDTKLALAEEFRALGDLEGARLLASEVHAQAPAHGHELRERAQRLLSELA